MALVFPLLLICAVVGLAWGLAKPHRVRVDADDAQEVLDVEREARGLRWAGLVVGLALAGLLLLLGDRLGGWAHLGRGQMLAPAVLAMCILVTTAVGELSVQPQAGRLRSASSRPRRVVDLVPRGLARLGVGSVLVAASVLAAGVVAGDPDDMGRAGRALTTVCEAGPDGVVATSTRGPWPGSFYGVPLLSLLGMGVVAALGALLVIRARPGFGAGARDADSVLRRRSARNVILAVVILALGPLGPVLALMAMPLLGGDCGPSWHPVVGVLATVGSLVSFTIAAASLGRLLGTARLVVSPEESRGAERKAGLR